ncbi:hypothetical protein GH733_006928 [Mirounga leonina]|nr:hypothetical protein GH733_006928 [Mirounga leonina]
MGRLLVGTFVALCLSCSRCFLFEINLLLLSLKLLYLLSLNDLVGASALCITYMLIEMNNYFAVDTPSAIALTMFGTPYPVSVSSGQVSHQTPPQVTGQLDKVIREGSTVDGVLEVQNEHFGALSFGSLAGSEHKRI